MFPINRDFEGTTLLDAMRYREDVVDKYYLERIVVYCDENAITSSDSITEKIVLDRFKLLYQHIRENLL